MIYKCNNQIYTAANPVQSLCLMFCLRESVKILYRDLRICFPEHCHYYSMVCLCRTFCTFFLQDQQQKAFYTSGSSLQQLREVKKKTEDTFTQWDTCNQAVVFILSYVLYSSFSPISITFFPCFVFPLFLPLIFSYSFLSDILWVQFTAIDIIYNVQFTSFS